MFLINRDKSKCVESISALIAKIYGIICGPLQLIKLQDYWLGWARSKAHENLHVFNNGILIGKLNFSEKPDHSPIYHLEELPIEFHPLSTGVKIISKPGNQNLLIEPLNITNIFYSKKSVSDMQLLIAKAEGLLPSSEGVGVLSTVGYLPGNVTLFNEIKKIPFLCHYNFQTHQLTNSPKIPYQHADDLMMIERLKEIVPVHSCQYLGISAGYDSRFVLGILLHSGVKPHLIHLNCDERKLIEEITQQLKLDCSIVDDFEQLSPEIYTLITDSQIYFRGGNYSNVRKSIERESLYHTGLFADSIIKNAFKTATKIPGPTDAIYDKLIDHALLSSCSYDVAGLREFNTRQMIKENLLKELAFGNDYCSFRTKKEWANWFYFLHRGVRWTPATTADLSYFTQPVFLLSDLEALSFGISSSAWVNFKKDRIRSINTKLLPEITVPYSDGGPYYINNGFLNSWEKIKYEYLERFLTYIKDRHEYTEARKNTNPFRNVDFDSTCFSRFFTCSSRELLHGSMYTYSVKRAAVTVGYTLQFLGH